VCVFQHWDVFKVITEVFILVPALVGLKGNLEMTLASRLSTAVCKNITNLSQAVTLVFNDPECVSIITSKHFKRLFSSLRFCFPSSSG